MKPFILLIFLFLTGCYTSQYMPYTGEQQVWPTAPGGFMATNTVIPAYYGYPPRPYIQVGQVFVATQSLQVNTLQVAARIAKQNGADAVCVLDNGTHYVGTVTSGFVAGGPNFASGFSSTAPIYGGNTKVLAIKFK